VLRGEMSQLLLRGHLGLHLTMVDRWRRDPGDPGDPAFYSRPQRYFDEAKRVATESTDFARDRRRIVMMPSVEAAREVRDRSLDFIFIDADHTYEGCRDDFAAWFPKLKPDGIFGGHDYDRPRYPNEGVKRAVDEFAAAGKFHVETDRDNCWFIHPAQSNGGVAGGLGDYFNAL
ncbi:MAG: class I SAM-dependent methyltransferase, partial [Verrucomicrobiae bacterium]|nr:class I SAM-dependent methyltransferase [Verrucomicrobiae bacterium]